MNLGTEIATLDSEASRTPLKHLVLEECNITVDGLKALLTYPKALEELYFGARLSQNSSGTHD